MTEMKTIAVTHKQGVAIVVVLAFVVAIAMFLYVLFGANTTITLQNRKTLGQLQAYFLAQSGLQHVLLKLRLLPKETYDAFKGGVEKPYPDIGSDLHHQLNFLPHPGNWSLYKPGASLDSSPVEGKYWLTEFKLESSLEGMSLVQDGYRITVEASVEGPAGLKFVDSVSEQIIVSRFTGGIGGP